MSPLYRPRKVSRQIYFEDSVPPKQMIVPPLCENYTAAMLPPLVERELKVALLRRKAHQQWLIAAWTAGAVTLVLLLVLGSGSPRFTGRTLFQVLFGLALFRVAWTGFSLTADLLSEERRNGTLGLLVLTGLGPLAIFSHKLLGAVMLAGYGLLGGLPFFALPFLTGGVPASQFIYSVVFLANGLLFCVAVGLFASVIHRDGGQAQLTAQAIAVGLCVLTPLLHWFGVLSGAPVLKFNWLVLSPALAPYLVLTGFARGPAQLFWFASTITLGYSVGALASAALLLHFTWREKSEASDPKRWLGFWQMWMRGSRRWHDVLRRRFLADKPFCWLATRDRPPVLIAYGVLFMGVAVWFLGWLTRGSLWTTSTNSFLSSILLHQALNVVGAYAAGRRFAEERLNGGFEILLTAPLQAADIVEGQGRALLVQFRGVAALTLLFDLVLCTAGVAGIQKGAPGVTTYVLVWVLMLAFWFAMHLESASKAMWISAWTGRPGFAAVKAGGARWWVLVYAWIFTRGRVSSSFWDWHFGVFLLVMLFLTFLSTFGSRRLLREKLTRELRQIASAPIPAREDKRFKSWDPNAIFPPTPWGTTTRARKPQPTGRMDNLNG